jgi:hypothetical protein
VPDMTMCKNKSCEIKEKCYRWSAQPSKYQSYSHFERPSENELCLHFIEVSQYNLSAECKQSHSVSAFNDEPLLALKEVL